MLWLLIVVLKVPGFPSHPHPSYFKMATNQSSRGCDIITTRFGGATTEVEWGKTTDQWGVWGGGGWPELMVRGWPDVLGRGGGHWGSGLGGGFPDVTGVVS